MQTFPAMFHFTSSPPKGISVTKCSNLDALILHIFYYNLQLYLCYLPVITTRTHTIYKVVKSIVISHGDLPIFQLGYVLDC